jgi:PAS domain S-box-containing protein
MASTPTSTSPGDERFFALSLDLLTVVGFDGWFKRLNPAWERQLGWTVEELLARPYADFIHPEDVERTLAEAARLAEPGTETLDFELRFAARDGSWRWLLLSAHGVLEEEAIYVVAKDFTDRKSAEQELAQSERRFRSVTESVSDAIVAADSDGVIVLWSPGAERTFGYLADEAIGHHVLELMPERYRDQHLEGLRRMREGGEPHVIGRTVELHGLRRDGTEFPLELSLGAWDFEDRSFYTGVMRDITARRTTERYLAAQSAVDRILVSSPPVDEAMKQVLGVLGEAMGWVAGGYWEPDADDDVLHCRAFWAADAERVREFEARSQDLALPRGSGLPGRVLESGEPAWVPDVTADANFPRRDVAERAGLHGAVGLPVVSAGGQVVAVLDFFIGDLRAPDEETVATMTVVTAQVGQYLRRKQAEEALAATAAELRRRAAELERSNAELEQFAYVASHDLSEPLRMIAGFVQLLSERYTGRLDGDADEFIAYTVDGVQRMQKLIDDLLAYSRVGRSVEDGPIDLGEIVEEARRALHAPIAERGAQLDVGSLPTVSGDRLELTQLFQNLLSNALKFVRDGTPEVEVRARRDGDWWEISVRDNGIGIEPRHADRIFKMFQRLHGREEFPGTGIGLAICKKIVDRHGGRIDFAPVEGGGSVFRVTLPAVPDEEAT